MDNGIFPSFSRYQMHRNPKIWYTAVFPQIGTACKYAISMAYISRSLTSLHRQYISVLQETAGFCMTKLVVFIVARKSETTPFRTSNNGLG
jgi:hypothetical protein